MAKFFAMTSKGLVDVLEQELKDMGLQKLERGISGVYFEGPWAHCYRANLRSRTATRIILPILDFPAYTNEDLYHNIRKHDFTKYIPANGTLAVDSMVRDSGAFQDQRFVSMKVKDAIVDQFREKFETRPDVDSKNPDLSLIVRCHKNQFSVAIDTSGEPLFKRGYRVGMTDAHVKEHLAAGLLLMTGWDRKSPVVDPMCGSGTFLIEAALMALNVSPGTMRKGFSFQRLNGFQRDEYEAEVDAAISEELEELPFKFYGYDVDKDALKVAKQNAVQAGVAELVELNRVPVQTLPVPPEKGIMIVDPPYGERMGNPYELTDLYADLAHTMKTSFNGWECFVLSGAPELSKAMKLKAERKFPVYNGPIECRLLKYTMF